MSGYTPVEGFLFPTGADLVVPNAVSQIAFEQDAKVAAFDLAIPAAYRPTSASWYASAAGSAVASGTSETISYDTKEAATWSAAASFPLLTPPGDRLSWWLLGADVQYTCSGGPITNSYTRIAMIINTADPVSGQRSNIYVYEEAPELSGNTSGSISMVTVQKLYQASPNVILLHTDGTNTRTPAAGCRFWALRLGDA